MPYILDRGISDGVHESFNKFSVDERCFKGVTLLFAFILSASLCVVFRKSISVNAEETSV